MRSSVKNVSFSLLCLFLGACNYYRPNTVQSATPPTQVTTKTDFESLTKVFFEPFCLRCHREGNPAGNPSLETYQAMIDADLLVPGRPEDSLIYTDSLDGSMPKRPPKPSAELVEMLRVWIADGAIEK